MEENNSKDPTEYRPGLTKIRKRRLVLWMVIVAYVPAMMLALESPNYRTWVTVVFSSWIVLLVIAVAFACIVRCPRCGEQFHTHGPTFLPLRRCLHCALHVNADKRDPEPDPPQPRFRKK
ncbi:MAG: hypothetical protein R6W66_05325 [Pelovirga sp.]|jgi:hypothetical protein